MPRLPTFMSAPRRPLRGPMAAGRGEPGAQDLRVRRLDVVVMASNHVELGGNRLLWIHPDLVSPGELITVLQCGDELALWSHADNPRLLGFHHLRADIQLRPSPVSQLSVEQPRAVGYAFLQPERAA